MRKIALILFTVLVFGTLLACSSSSCSDSGGADYFGPCPPDQVALWSDTAGRYTCVNECPSGYSKVKDPYAWYEICKKNCSDGNPPTFNYDTTEWECSSSPTSTPTSSPTDGPTSTPTPTPTATATPTATPTSGTSCIQGTWTGNSQSNKGWGDQGLTFIIQANGTSLSGTAKHTSAGVTTASPATGTIGSTTPPTSFSFGNSADTTYVGTFEDCDTITGTYTDVNGDSGTFTLYKVN